ncbi:succinate-semialdehyde dehydrogenase [Flavobacterium rivuli WB 3.3-2 = DSM 21788]|uniref:Succinate-semialdehyde dehydrogenase n=1 Tax=Flavobacterium rivuli WB 3.3-2 = DSM 21788 TaxID=1121895 RepID=A0A0A2M1X6_9FLAO|nr:NAD-dependent succinate-semialdehyde dehydrogenase [Flavobacterium rivuli]KGO86254.1 succinate-semialdehyde dehydrogenase [Flavobacterium rivuli WB 3.3-2 = DSM 21788]
MFSIINPFDSTFLSEHQYITDSEVENTLKISKKSFDIWGFTPVNERLNFIKNLVFALTKKQHLLAKQCSLEMGKPITQALAEVKKCQILCEYYLNHAEKFLEKRQIEANGSESYVTYEPLGVILGVMPWNFPYWQVFRFAIPTIIAGNTVVVKHASNIAGCAILIEELFREAGFPDGIYTNLLISGSQVKAVIENPIVKAVSLTGSEKAGASVASIAANKIKKAVLELGGSNGLIVCEDADIDKTVEIAVNARFQNAGQSCIAAKRFFVHSSLFDAFIEKFTKAVSKLKAGNPLNEDTYVGPLARTDLAEDVEKQVNKSVEMGAKIVLGGKRTEAFYEPTILVNVTTDMPVFNEEVFGPAVPVLSFNTFEEAVELSNKSDFGLGVSVFTADVEALKEKINLFQEGAVFINAMVKSDPALPFGGVKRSGYGRELAEDGIKEFVNVKTVYIG